MRSGRNSNSNMLCRAESQVVAKFHDSRFRSLSQLGPLLVKSFRTQSFPSQVQRRATLGHFKCTGLLDTRNVRHNVRPTVTAREEHSQMSQCESSTASASGKMEDLEERFQCAVISEGRPPVLKDGCVFCNIVAGTDDKNKIVYQNSEVAIFQDLHPASKDHLLVIPTNHVSTIKAFTRDDKPKLEYLYNIGKAVLAKRGGDIAQARVGFHWPPFHSIEHLHLHIIYPESEMTFFKRLIYRPDSLYFATYAWTLDWLGKRPNRFEVPPACGRPTT